MATLIAWSKGFGRYGSDYMLVFDNRSIYVGNCTVWHSFPSFHRCPTWREHGLADIWTAIENGMCDDKKSSREKLEEMHSAWAAEAALRRAKEEEDRKKLIQESMRWPWGLRWAYRLARRLRS